MAGHLVEEVRERGVGALLPTGFDDAFDDVGADVADRSHAEADISPDRGEVERGFVDVRGQHGDAEAAALVEVDRELVLVVSDRGQQGRHVFGRVMGLEESGPVGHDAVGGRVRLVERVVRERQQDVPQCLSGSFGVAAFLHTAEEADLLLVELGLLLLAHRTAEDVGLAEGVSGDLLRDRHHLLLVDDEAVGGVEDVLERLLELRVDRGDLLEPVLAQRIVRMRICTHRTGPVERQGRGDILEVIRLHHPQQGAQTAAVELEHAEGVTASQQLIRRRIVEAQMLEIEIIVPVGFDVLHCVGDDREVSQSQEVHLDEPEALRGRIVELGDDLTVLEPAHDRDDVDDRVRGHDDTGGVDAPLTLQPFEALRGFEGFSGLRVGVDEFAELAGFLIALGLRVLDVLERNVLGHLGRRQRLRQPLTHREGFAEHTRGVLQRHLRLDRAVGDDHRNALVAVLLGHIVDDLGAATIIEVDVEVGHGHTVRVEEALEEQTVLQRIEVGDAHRVGDHGTGTRTTAGSDADPVVLRPVDEVGDDEEVAGEAHRDDDVELVVGLLADFVGNAVGVAVVESLGDFLDQP